MKEYLEIEQIENEISKQKLPVPVYFITELNNQIARPEYYLKTLKIFGRIYIPEIGSMTFLQTESKEFDIFYKLEQVGLIEYPELYVFSRSFARANISEDSVLKFMSERTANPFYTAVYAYQEIIMKPRIKIVWRQLNPEIKRFPETTILGNLNEIQPQKTNNNPFLLNIKGQLIFNPRKRPAEPIPPLVILIGESEDTSDKSQNLTIKSENSQENNKDSCGYYDDELEELLK